MTLFDAIRAFLFCFLGIILVLGGGYVWTMYMNHKGRGEGDL